MLVKNTDLGARRLLLFLHRLTAEAVYRVACLVKKFTDMGARRLLLFLFRLTAEAVYRVARLVKTRWSECPRAATSCIA